MQKFSSAGTEVYFSHLSSKLSCFRLNVAGGFFNIGILSSLLYAANICKMTFLSASGSFQPRELPFIFAWSPFFFFFTTLMQICLYEVELSS